MVANERKSCVFNNKADAFSVLRQPFGQILPNNLKLDFSEVLTYKPTTNESRNFSRWIWYPVE
jgi:hypothetical protein